VKGVDSQNPLAEQEAYSNDRERDYRKWCLENCLFLNPLNDVGAYPAAGRDSIYLPGHVVRVDAPHRFESFFDQIKQEYVSARWLLYEGSVLKAPHFADAGVALRATEPPPVLSLGIERVKAAFRASYSLFDKVGFFVNAYMELNIPDKDMTFRSVWRPEDKEPIRKEFDTKSNWGFCALYSLAKDLFDTANDKLAESPALRLKDVKDCIEQKYLRVTTVSSPTIPPDDLALTIPREEFETLAMRALKLARCSIVYLTIAVRLEEQRRENIRTNTPIEELPPIPELPESERI
jgi:hypothetical protein